MSRVQKTLRKVVSATPQRLVWFLSSMSDTYWERLKEKESLALFHTAVRTVPAYRTYLENCGLEHPESIKTYADFCARVPIMDKDSYLKRFPLNELSGPGVSDMYTATTSSGSSGQPYFMLHSKHTFDSIGKAISGLVEYQWDYFTPKKRVLYINSLALGMWLGGVIGDHVTKYICQHHSGHTVCSPGADAEMTVDTIKRIGDRYDSVLIVSYPTMLKNIIEYGEQQGIDWKKYNLKIVSFGELIDNSLNDYLVSRISDTEGDFMRILDLYGGTEVGNPGIGTPLTAKIKQIARKNPSLSEKIFGNRESIGALFQANPMNSWTEEVGGELVITQSEKVPVIRYNIHDVGRVFTWKEMHQILKEEGIDITAELKKCGWTKKPFKWSFIVFTNRKDWAVSFYGAKVAPQSIQHLFMSDPLIYSFRLSSADEAGEMRFVVHIELQPGTELSQEDTTKMVRHYRDLVCTYLQDTNFDYKDAYTINESVLTPLVLLDKYGEGVFKRTKAGKAKLV